MENKKLRKCINGYCAGRKSLNTGKKDKRIRGAEDKGK